MEDSFNNYNSKRVMFYSIISFRTFDFFIFKYVNKCHVIGLVLYLLRRLFSVDLINVIILLSEIHS